MYKLYDTLSREFRPKEYKTLRTATKQADRLDLNYGAVRYIVVPWVEKVVDMLKERE